MNTYCSHMSARSRVRATAFLLWVILPFGILYAVPSQPDARATENARVVVGRYELSRDNEGRLLRSRDGWVTAEDISRPAPGFSGVPGVAGVQGFVRIAAVAQDPNNHLRFAAVGADDLYLTTDAGTSWEALDIKSRPTINSSLKFTAVAISPHNPDHLLLGTSYNGFFESTDRGRSFSRLSSGRAFAFMDRGAGFQEEVKALGFDPTERNLMYFELAFGGGSYSYRRNTGEVKSVTDPELVSFMRGGTNAALGVELLHTTTGNGPENARISERAATDDQAAFRRSRAADRTGIYIAAHRARGHLLAEYLDLVAEHGMNSIVVDFKDDFGMLRYHSSNETARAAGAVRPLFDAAELIRAAHERDIYVIARVVVFQDPRLYAYDNHRYALWDSRLDRPWGVFRSSEDGERQVESWVDPYSDFVHQYNVQIAREIQDLGVDEIQFDYIRFPSDGATRDILARHRGENTDRVAALSTFLSKAREALELPIGVDVYGFNAWYRMVYLGQDIEEMARYVDVISPMLYPSHFPRSFHGEYEYLDWAEFLYREGSLRSTVISGGVLIRPYIQAFLIGSELQFSTPYYREYLLRQLAGSREGGASGFTLWNASGRYYMIGEPLLPFTRPAESTSEEAADDQSANEEPVHEDATTEEGERQ
ncbi:MAG: hypothetical protein EA428_12345 [Spirochaetaceae bacterium]|nr:MAG: hypothetical protein EA428_12345 [Spirochaetaceae bacterium]